MTSRTSAAPQPTIPLTADDIKRLAGLELARPSRVGHALLLVASLTMTSLLGALWATEPTLPVRTHVAFGAMLLIGLAWAGFATWVLARRRVLYGVERVIAARMGLLFSAASGLAFLAMGYSGALVRAGYLAAASNGLLCLVALAFLIEARHRVAALNARRQALERLLRREA